MKRMIIKQNDANTLFLSYHGDNGFYFPYSAEKDIDWRMHHMSKQGPFDRWLLEKYTERAIRILPTDTVIDCGAFVGAFSIAAFKQGAKKVFSIEPSSKNYKCTNLNIQHYNAQDVITAHNIGLGDTNTELELNISTQGCEDSFLECDMGSTGNTELVKVKTLDWFINEHNLDENNLYVKVEAEGFELEIVNGLEMFKPRVISIDVTPERDGLSPREDITKILNKHNYNITNTRRCLFGTR